MTDHVYSFGCLQWEGQTFREDLLILPDGQVVSPWRRQRGHRLSLDDLREVLPADPRVLIIGTGQMGAMKVSDDLLEALAERGIDAQPLRTPQALRRFLTVRRQKRAAAALHLTC